MQKLSSVMQLNSFESWFVPNKLDPYFPKKSAVYFFVRSDSFHLGAKLLFELFGKYLQLGDVLKVTNIDSTVSITFYNAPSGNVL